MNQLAIITIIVSILLIISSIAKSIMDLVDFKFSQSIFSKIKSEKWRYWFNQEQGWRNKYKDRDPKKGPAFLCSTTCFVFITDAWHFFQMVKLTCYDLSITIPIIILSGISFWYLLPIVLIMKGLKGLVFESFWTSFFIKK